MGELDLMRVDHIGSLRRPQALLDLRARVDDGEATSDELTALEDELIREVIAEQERIGFPIVTDGEFRRSNFQDSFGAVRLRLRHPGEPRGVPSAGSRATAPTSSNASSPARRSPGRPSCPASRRSSGSR